MSKNFLLRIEEPCHENWDRMTPRENGRFCDVCSKQVVDFSAMSDAQLLAYFRKPSTGSVCGRFNEVQLERPLRAEKKKLPWHIFFFRVLLPALFLGRAQAQERMGKVAPVPGVTNTVNSSRETVTLGMVLPSRIVPATCNGSNDDWNKEPLRVRVVNDRDEPLAFASLRLLRSGQVWVADSVGLMTVKAKELKEGDSLECSAAGYVTQTRSYNTRTREMDFVLTANPALAEVVVVAGSEHGRRRILMGAVARITAKEMGPLIDTSLEHASTHKLTLYPNPARAGSTLNIRLEQPAEGYYQCRLLTLQGQLLLEREIWLDEHAGLLTLELPVVSPGTYVLVMTEKRTGKRVGEKLVVM